MRFSSCQRRPQWMLSEPRWGTETTATFFAVWMSQSSTVVLTRKASRKDFLPNFP